MKETLKHWLWHLKRMSWDLGLFAFIFIIFITGAYTALPAALQLVALKSLLVSSGLLSGHLSGKLLFPKVDWQDKWTPGHAARIALYVVSVYAFSIGG